MIENHTDTLFFCDCTGCYYIVSLMWLEAKVTHQLLLDWWVNIMGESFSPFHPFFPETTVSILHGKQQKNLKVPLTEILKIKTKRKDRKLGK